MTCPRVTERIANIFQQLRCFALARSYAQTRHANQIQHVREERAVLDCPGGVRYTGMTGHEVTMQLRWA